MSTTNTGSNMPKPHDHYTHTHNNDTLHRSPYNAPYNAHTHIAIHKHNRECTLELADAHILDSDGKYLQLFLNRISMHTNI